MKVAFFSIRNYDRVSLCEAFEKAQVNGAPGGVEAVYYSQRLCEATLNMAQGCKAVCIFVNDKMNGDILKKLNEFGVTLVLLRCAGYDMVDLAAAKALNIKVLRVPQYSPYAVAEHAIGLVMLLNRKLHRAYNRTREFNFQLDGLLGFDMNGRTVGIIGTGKIGSLFGKICKGTLRFS
jgi:D-lactate dehydrogenase